MTSESSLGAFVAAYNGSASGHMSMKLIEGIQVPSRAAYLTIMYAIAASLRRLASGCANVLVDAFVFYIYKNLDVPDPRSLSLYQTDLLW